MAVAAADRIVGRIRLRAARVTHGGVNDARNALVSLLGMPESAERKHRRGLSSGLVAVGVGAAAPVGFGLRAQRPLGQSPVCGIFLWPATGAFSRVLICLRSRRLGERGATRGRVWTRGAPLVSSLQGTAALGPRTSEVNGGTGDEAADFVTYP